jgi:hypothetical protein
MWSRALVLLGVLALVAATPRGASGSSATRGALVNMTPPSVIGPAIVGQILTAFPGVWISDLPLELRLQWRRCPVAGSCTDIADATTPTYVPAPDDIGMQIQLRVTAGNGGATEVRDSEPTEAVSDEWEPGATGSTGTPATPSPPAVAPVSGAERGRMLDPFPVVRIRGRFSAHWTLFTLVTVRAPVGALIAMECSGRGCAFRTQRRTVSRRTLVRIAGLERRFRPGARIVLRVTQPGRIGKYTRITVRRDRPPARWDACVRPASPEPVACSLA